MCLYQHFSFGNLGLSWKSNESNETSQKNAHTTKFLPPILLCTLFPKYGGSLVAQMVKNLPAMQETQVWSLVRKICWIREWLPISVFFPGEFQGLLEFTTERLMLLLSHFPQVHPFHRLQVKRTNSQLIYCLSNKSITAYRTKNILLLIFIIQCLLNKCLLN